MNAAEAMRELVASVQHGLGNQQYRDAPGLSHSDSKRLRKSPWHYHAMTLPGAEVRAKQPTPQMRNGTLVHCALLEPEQFDFRYKVCELNRNSNAYKDELKAADAAGIELISLLERERAIAQADALRRDPVIAQLLAAGGESEVSVWWTCPRTGVLCKARPDKVAPFGDGRSVVLLDVKTTTDADEFAFARSVADYGYHTQADWYCEGYGIAAGVDVRGMVFGVCESEYPHAARSFMLDDNALERARAENDNARHLFRSCTASGDWPGYPSDSDGVTVISLPKWY